MPRTAYEKLSWKYRYEKNPGETWFGSCKMFRDKQGAYQMTKTISFRVSDKEYRTLKEEADSIPSSLSAHMKYWIMIRNEALEESYQQGLRDAKKDTVE